MRHWQNRGKRQIRLALPALAVAASIPSSSGAKPVIVGSTLGAGKASKGEVVTEGTYFNSSLSEPGAHVVSPVDGAIIEVNLFGNNEGPYRVRVLSTDGGSSYTAKASSPLSSSIRTGAGKSNSAP